MNCYQREFYWTRIVDNRKQRNEFEVDKRTYMYFKERMAAMMFLLIIFLVVFYIPLGVIFQLMKKYM